MFILPYKSTQEWEFIGAVHVLSDLAPGETFQAKSSSEISCIFVPIRLRRCQQMLAQKAPAEMVLLEFGLKCNTLNWLRISSRKQPFPKLNDPS